jgi:hypothetical protein
MAFIEGNEQAMTSGAVSVQLPTGQHRPFQCLPQAAGSCCFRGLCSILGSPRRHGAIQRNPEHKHSFIACSSGG